MTGRGIPIGTRHPGRFPGRVSSVPVATVDDIARRRTFGRGLTRPILAYLAILTLVVWAGYAVVDLQQGGDLVGAAVVAAGALVGYGLLLVVFLGLLLIPALALTIALVHRFEAASRVARALIGAGSWAGWCLFVTITLAVASGIVLEPGALATDVLVFIGAGAAFSLLAFNGYERQAGRVLTLVALAVGALVIIGSVWMAGRWGGPV
jgi:hypothetical protein